MNCGLGNLDSLKKHLLAKSMSSDVSFDTLIKDIGLGVAADFEEYCTRKFLRVEGATYVCTADRDHCYLDRYPFEMLTKTELKSDINVGWELQDGLVLNTNPLTGLIYWGAGISFAWAQMRFTFTGGFWFETAEPDDAAYPSVMPDGATALPNDLRLAWLLQCRQVWDLADKLGSGLIDAPKVQSALMELELVPQVKNILNSHRRMSLT